MKLKFTGFKKKFRSKILKFSLYKNLILKILSTIIPSKVIFSHKTDTFKRRTGKMWDDSWICWNRQISTKNFPNLPLMIMELYCFKKPAKKTKQKLMLKMNWAQKNQKDCIIVVATKNSYLNHTYGFQSQYMSTERNFWRIIKVKMVRWGGLCLKASMSCFYMI